MPGCFGGWVYSLTAQSVSLMSACWTVDCTLLPAPSAPRQTHACSNSNASAAKPMAFALSHTSALTPSTAFRHLPPWRKDVVNQCLEFDFGPHIWNTLPQDFRHSLFFQKQTQDISVLRIFQSGNIVLNPYQSVQRYIWTLADVYIMC